MILPSKKELQYSPDYLGHCIEKFGTHVQLCVAMDLARVRDVNTTALVISLGRATTCAVMAKDVETGKMSIISPGCATVADDGQVGRETAHFFAAKGWNATTPQVLENIGIKIGIVMRFCLKHEAERARTQIAPQIYIHSLETTQVICPLPDRHGKGVDADLVAFVVANTNPARSFWRSNRNSERTVIGDGYKALRISEAI